MAEQKNSPQKRKNARSAFATGVTGTILPSDLAIPCWVAPLQSPTPFHQAEYSVARKMNLGDNATRALEIQNRHKRLPGPASQNRHKRLPARCEQTRTISASENRNLWYNSYRYQPTINPLSVFKRRAHVGFQAPRDTVNPRQPPIARFFKYAVADRWGFALNQEHLVLGSRRPELALALLGLAEQGTLRRVFDFRYSTAETRATRKPRLTSRSPGEPLPRFADRQVLARLNQQPPRSTRSEPPKGPTGSSIGDFA
jgi:hypothetical protein